MEVAPSHVPAYLQAAAELAAELLRRGQHFWLFRHPAEPGRFLEFRESAAERGRGDSEQRRPNADIIGESLHDFLEQDPLSLIQ